MKDHQIALLVNDVVKEINTRLIGYQLPQCLRGIVSRAVVKNLIDQGLKEDPLIRNRDLGEQKV